MFQRIMEVSELRPYDRARLSASFYYHYDDRVNCSRLREETTKRGLPPAEVDRLVFGKYGCNKISDKSSTVIDGVAFHSCLCNYQHPAFFSYVDLMYQMDRGILPDKGAYLDQPAQLLEAVQLLTRLRAEAQQAERAQSEQKAAHGR